MKRPLDPMVVLISLILLVPVVTGPFLACGASNPSPGSPLAVEAATCLAKRARLQLECVDMHQTRPEIDACRAKVQREVDCTVKDGGDQ